MLIDHQLSCAGRVDFAAISEASSRIRGFCARTPLLESVDLNRRLKGRLLLKAESLQITGSFKLRGAANRLLALTGDERAAERTPTTPPIGGADRQDCDGGASAIHQQIRAGRAEHGGQQEGGSDHGFFLAETGRSRELSGSFAKRACPVTEHRRRGAARIAFR